MMRIRTGEDEYLEVEDGIEVVDLDTDLYYYDGERLTEARAAAPGARRGRPPDRVRGRPSRLGELSGKGELREDA
jgi:hypothetical protein